MGRIFCQPNSLDRSRYRLDGIPIHRRARCFADVCMMVKDMERDRKFPCDGQVENLSVASGALGDILAFEFLQVSFASFLAYRHEHIADKYRRSGTAAGRPHHLTLPARIQQILIALRKLTELDHPGIIAGGSRSKGSSIPRNLGNPSA